MFKIDDIIVQVLKNCDIADSQHAGLYSICGLALRLRDLYKWENGLEPWIEKDASEVLKWIGDKEETWEKLLEKEFGGITILGNRFDPFDAKGINSVLESHGFIYGGGYARGLKPSFFLAEIEDKKEINGYTIFILGHEFARDLLTIPALSQDNCIFIRQEPAKLFLWDQISYINKSGRYALRFGLESYGLKKQTSREIQRHLTRIAAGEIDRYIYHELGEIQDHVFDRKIWRQIIATFPHTPIELLVRTVKDLLADTNEYGTLQHIIRQRKTASLAFYVAFIENLTKELFPQLREAFKNFTQTGDWGIIAQSVDIGYHTAKQYTNVITGIYQHGKGKNDMKWVEKEITRRFLPHVSR